MIVKHHYFSYKGTLSSDRDYFHPLQKNYLWGV